MRILIIENDRKAQERLEKLLGQVAPEKKVSGRCAGIKDAAVWMGSHPLPDLIFSRVQLPDGLSIDLLKKLPRKVPVIFTCSYDKYAMDAFKANGIDYLLKPVQKEALQEAIERYNTEYSAFHRQPEALQPAADNRAPHYQERFIVQTGRQMKLVKAEEIAYFFTENKIVYLVTFVGEKYATDYTLEKVEKLLRPELFFRINRQFIINLSSIVKMTPASKARLSLHLKPETRLEAITSTERTAAFRKWLLGGL